MWKAISSNVDLHTTVLSDNKSGKLTSRILISGPTKTGKTSLAFRMAYEAASKGSIVLFVCLQTKMSSNFPLPINLPLTENRNDSPSSGSDSRLPSWSPAILSRIMFKYVTNTAELKKLFASIHTIQPSPQCDTCVVVDDYLLIIDPMSTVNRQDHQFIEICQILGAFLVDAVDYLDKATEIQQTKLLLVGDSLDASFISMMFRYVDVAILLQPIVVERDGMTSHSNYIYGGNSFTYTMDGGNNTENMKNIKMVLKQKFSPPGLEDKVIVSSITLKNEQLVCAI